MDSNRAAFFPMPQSNFGAQAGLQALFHFGHFRRWGFFGDRWGFLSTQFLHEFLGLADIEPAC